MKNDVFWDLTRCGSCKTDVSEEQSASIIRVARIGEVRTTLAVSSNQRTHARCLQFLDKESEPNCSVYWVEAK
jgi:hypothetical protein